MLLFANGYLSGFCSLVKELCPCSALNRIDNNIESGETNYIVIHQENTSDIWNELISLFVGSCCVFRAQLICSADGEGGFDFNTGMEALRTSEQLVGATG